jgi:hypothetical protein
VVNSYCLDEELLLLFFIRKMVWENNITSVPQMKTLLEVFMKEALFSGHHIPSITNKRFWPSNIDIQNHIKVFICGTLVILFSQTIFLIWSFNLWSMEWSKLAD